MKNIVFVALVLGCAGSVQAAFTGYGLRLSGPNNNVPTVRLYNASDNADIVSFSMTVGDTTKGFDGVQGEVVGSVDSFLLQSPDYNMHGGARSGAVAYQFGGFDAGEQFQFEVDVDNAGGDAMADYRYVFFNNGSYDNSLITVAFSNKVVLSGTLPDFDLNNDNVYGFKQGHEGEQNGPTVPVPGAVLLGSLGTGLVGWFRRRRSL